MKKQIVIGMIVVFGAISLNGPDAIAADKFEKLTGSQIRAKLAGMEITDEVHWRDVFERSGILTTYSMGKKSAGKWRVQKDELCLDRGKEDGGCYEVWLAGKKVELRRQGSSLPLEGVLRTPAKRN